MIRVESLAFQETPLFQFQVIWARTKLITVRVWLPRSTAHVLSIVVVLRDRMPSHCCRRKDIIVVLDIPDIQFQIELIIVYYKTGKFVIGYCFKIIVAYVGYNINSNESLK